jgi:hypothetical protein
MFREHVGLFRLSSAEVQVQNTPHCLPSPSPQGRVAKKRKNQLRSTTVTTPRSLLMAAIKSISPYSWNHLSTSLTHPLPISFLFSYTVLSHHSLILEHYSQISRSHLLPSFGTPGTSHQPQGQSLSYAGDQRRLDVLLTFTTFVQSLQSVGVSSGLRRHLLGHLRQVTTIR